MKGIVKKVVDCNTLLISPLENDNEVQIAGDEYVIKHILQEFIDDPGATIVIEYNNNTMIVGDADELF